MATRGTLPIAGQLAKSDVAQVNSQRSINLYPFSEQVGGKTTLTLRSTPGLTLIASGDYAIRGNAVVYKNKVYFVQGQFLKRMGADGIIETVGALNSMNGHVSMCSGRSAVFLVDGDKGYYTNGPGTTLTTINDADFFNRPFSCCYINSFFVVNNRDSDKFAISGIEDPSTWDALDFAQSDKAPDDTIAVTATYGDLYAMGEYTTQVYYYSGNADFPFDLYSNGTLQYGLEAPASIAEVEGGIFFVGKTRQGGRIIIGLRGFQAQKISTADIDKQLEKFSTVSDAEGFAYMHEGQTFYEVTFPEEDITFVYHVDQRAWHQRKSNGMGRHRVKGHAFFNGWHVVGDFENGNIYRLDPLVYTENGEQIERIRETSILHSDRRLLTVHALEIEYEAGVGLVSGQGSDPQSTLTYSKDGGKTWSSAQSRDMGEIGEYGIRCVWRNFGTSRQFTFRNTITDPIPVTIINAYMDITARPS